jgi:rhamnulokinase
MSRLFVACELGEKAGRVLLGSLHKDRLTVSEVRRFDNIPSKEKDGLQWNVAQLYQDVLTGLRDVGNYDEPVDGISCTSWGGDYLLFHADASFIPPTFHHGDARTATGRQLVLKKLPAETLYEETGVSADAPSTLFQLASEAAKRLKRADHLMPVADGFNFLLSGVPCVEASAASATQLFNPVTRTWSPRVTNLLSLPPKLLPSVVASGTKLKPLRPELAVATRLTDPHIVASCSNELAAAMAGLPLQDGDSWACIRLGRTTAIATELNEPAISLAGRETGLSHTLGHHGKLLCHAETVGLAVLEECREIWAKTDYMLDDGVLAYLAAAAEPLESLVNLADPRFAAPGDMVAKVQAYCRETGQTVPRKPGPMFRCLMESLACLYRKTLDELAHATGREFSHVYLLSESNNNLLHHFIANALNKPVLVAPVNAAAIGNIIVQARALGRIKSDEEARQLLQQSFKMVTIHSHPAPTWMPAYDRFLEMSGARTVLAEA